MDAGTLKSTLYRLGVLGLLSRWRSGTARYLRGGYAPRRFWEAWGERFAGQGYQQGIHAGQRWLRAALERSSVMDDPVLEVGCGFGRNLAYLRAEGENRSFFGADISLPLLRCLRETPGLEGRGVCAEAAALPFRDGTFETVFTHGLLMHLTPELLPAALRELARLARRRVLLVEEIHWRGMKRQGSLAVNGYTFLHDYPDAVAELGWRVSSEFETGGGVNLCCLECLPHDG